MVPTRSTRSSSRRSSILKPPKPRHPLQNLNFNSSSNESSPATTTKIKRRVSFAEKKHVKEFCNSVEQGTVWDNTYEEHDLSNLKVSCNSNQEECEVETVCKENIFDSAQDNEVQFTCEKVIEKDVNIRDDIVHVASIVEDVNHQEEVIQDEPISPVEIPLKRSRISTSIIVYKDQDDKLPEKLSQLPELNVNNFNCNKLNATSVEDTSMDFTKIVCNNMCTDENNVDSNEAEQRLKNVSMEFTEAVLPSINVQNFEDNVLDQDKSMEFTIAIPSVMRSNDIDNIETAVCSVDDKTKKIDISMEVTSVVSNALCSLQTDISKPACSDNRAIVFHDMSMEITKAVKTNVYESSDKPAVIQKAAENKCDVTSQCENTKFLDMSMEMTRPVPINVHSLTKNRNIAENRFKKLRYDTDAAYEAPENCDKTRTYCDEDMEFTTVITPLPKVHQDNLEKSMQDIPSPKPSTPSPVLQNCGKENANRTTVFRDQSMTMTKVISTLSRNINNEEDNLEESVQDIPSPKPSTPSPVLQNCGKENANRTTVFRDQSMTMTKVISTLSRNINNEEDNLEESVQDIPSPQPSTPSPVLQNCGKENANRTTVFRDQSMTMTKVISTLSRNINNEEDNLEESMQDIPCTKPSTPSPVLQNRGKENANRTTVFHDQSVTMTKVISTLSRSINNEVSGKTMDVSNTSMEITEAVVTPQFRPEVAVPVTDSNEVRQSMSFENVNNKDLSQDSLTRTEIPQKNISITITSPLVKSATMSEKENHTVNNSSENFEKYTTEESTPIEVQNSANTKPSMALHESVQSDTRALAFKESNTETACATINSINVELHENECLQNTVPYSRRTYTIQSLNNDHSIPTNNVENHDTLAMDNDTSDIFFTKNLEELESIKPPSFVCLDDISQPDMSINVSGNQEIVTEPNCFLRTENLENLEKNFSDRNFVQVDQENEQIEEKHVRKSRTFLINRASVNDKRDNSLLEQENQISLNETEQSKLLDSRHTNMEIQVLECSSLMINNMEECTASDKKKDSQDLGLENSNLEDQSMECSLTNIRAIDGDRAETEYSNKLIDTDVKEANHKFYANGPSEINLESNASPVEESSSVELDSFTTLMTELKICSTSDKIIWEVYHENIEKHVFVIGFISCSLLVVIYLHDPSETYIQYLKDIRIISRLTADAEPLISMVHRLILEKLDTVKLVESYKNREDIIPMLDHISKEVKLAMDFMFEVRLLYDINLMEITRDSLSFISRTKRMDIILKITIDMKPFDKIESQNISVRCLYGSVREEDVKKLITNIKRDHKFLRRYISDVKDYIYLMEETGVIQKSY